MTNDEMSKKLTLKLLFSESKPNLAEALRNLALPRDAQQVLKIVTDHLGNLLENKNAYRQSLTEAEDYILQSVLQLFRTQQNLAKEIAGSVMNVNNCKKSCDTSKNTYWSIIGAGVGTAVGAGVGAIAKAGVATGAVVGVGIGAVVGAVAGTALAIYLYARYSDGSKEDMNAESTDIQYIDIDKFLSIVENICENIDGVVETYRTQVKRVENAFEMREKPSLTNNYSALLDQIVNVCNTCSGSENIPSKLRQAIDLLAETLENYDLKIENGKIVNV